MRTATCCVIPSPGDVQDRQVRGDRGWPSGARARGRLGQWLLTVPGAALGGGQRWWPLSSVPALRATDRTRNGRAHPALITGRTQDAEWQCWGRTEGSHRRDWGALAPDGLGAGRGHSGPPHSRAQEVLVHTCGPVPMPAAPPAPQSFWCEPQTTAAPAPQLPRARGPPSLPPGAGSRPTWVLHISACRSAPVHGSPPKAGLQTPMRPKW